MTTLLNIRVPDVITNEFLLNIVQERGIVDMIMDLKYDMEMYENVLIYKLRSYTADKPELLNPLRYDIIRTNKTRTIKGISGGDFEPRGSRPPVWKLRKGIKVGKNSRMFNNMNTLYGDLTPELTFFRWEDKNVFLVVVPYINKDIFEGTTGRLITEELFNNYY